MLSYDSRKLRGLLTPRRTVHSKTAQRLIDAAMKPTETYIGREVLSRQRENNPAQWRRRSLVKNSSARTSSG